LLALGAGAVLESQIAPEAPDGRTALLCGVNVRTWRLQLGRHLERAATESIDIPWLRRSLARVAPSARLVQLSPDIRDSQRVDYPLAEIRRLLLDAARGRTGFKRLGTTEATVLAPGGEPELLVLVPPGSENSPAWRAEAADLLRCAEVGLTLANVVDSRG
jgi:hypothetical protein